MRPCTRFHIEDVQVGDVLRLVPDSDSESPEPVQVTVGSVYRTTNFGWAIQPQNGRHDDALYLSDFDSVALVTPCAAPSPDGSTAEEATTENSAAETPPLDPAVKALVLALSRQVAKRGPEGEIAFDAPALVKVVRDADAARVAGTSRAPTSHPPTSHADA